MPTSISVDVISGTRIRVRFSDSMRDDGALRSPQSYTITPLDGGSPVYVGSVTPEREDAPAYVDLDVTEQTDGCSYNVTADDLLDDAGNPVGPISDSFVGSGAGPTILRVEAKSANLADVVFDERILDNAYARDPASFQWDNGLVTVAVLFVKKDTVRLVTSDQAPGTVYTLTIPPGVP